MLSYILIPLLIESVLVLYYVKGGKRSIFAYGSFILWGFTFIRLYFLDYELSYTITLASSRSMEPVERKESYLVNEIFMEDGQVASQEMIDQDLVLPIENGEINVAESVADNILLNIPLKVLTAAEEAGSDLPTGRDWQVMTEEDYQKYQADKKEENSPFAGLQGLFDE